MASPRMRAASMAIEVFLELGLPGEFGQAARAKSRFELQLVGLRVPGNQLPVGHRATRLPYQFQSAPEQRLELLRGAARFGLAHRGFGLRARAAQVEQGGEHVLVGGRERSVCGRRGLLAGRRREACRATPAPCARRSSFRRPGFSPAGPPRRGGCARITSAADRPERIFMASVGPMPLTEISFSNSAFSSCVRNPYRASASSRTWVWIRSRTSAPASGSRVNVETGWPRRSPLRRLPQWPGWDASRAASPEVARS